MRSKIAKRILDETPQEVRDEVKAYGDRVVSGAHSFTEGMDLETYERKDLPTRKQEGNMIYLIQFEQTTQVTEDSWRVIRPSLEVDEHVHLRDILKWATDKNKGRMPEKIEIREIELLNP